MLNLPTSLPIERLGQHAGAQIVALAHSFTVAPATRVSADRPDHQRSRARPKPRAGTCVCGRFHTVRVRDDGAPRSFDNAYLTSTAEQAMPTGEP